MCSAPFPRIRVSLYLHNRGVEEGTLLTKVIRYEGNNLYAIVQMWVSFDKTCIDDMWVKDDRIQPSSLRVLYSHRDALFKQFQ
jgi:hypothetical protein